jgi:hypothetical protein
MVLALLQRYLQVNYVIKLEKRNHYLDATHIFVMRSFFLLRYKIISWCLRCTR